MCVFSDKNDKPCFSQSYQKIPFFQTKALVCLNNNPFSRIVFHTFHYKNRFLVVRLQVSGARCAGSRCQVPDARCLVRGVRCQAPAVRYQIPGARDQVTRDHVCFTDEVQHQNVKKFHIKNILRLNGYYKHKLTNTFSTTLIFSLCNCLNCLILKDKSVL